jgi:galactose mutarotase-like enzyme
MARAASRTDRAEPVRGGAIEIGSDRLVLRVEPDLGGKVTELRCRHHGRQWLAPRLPQLDATAGGAYGPAEAWGWDELFPSVLPGASAPSPWPAPLRDHGELWGRPWRIVQHDPSVLALAYAAPRLGFEFERLLEVEGAIVKCAYRLSSQRDQALPFQWSMHPIFSLDPGERLELPGVHSVAATGTGHRLLPGAPATLSWPVHGGLDLAHVREADGETILKLYAALPASAAVAIRDGDCELSIRPGPALTGDVGIYVNYGGWPAMGPLHQIGIEPTNSPADDLETALRSDQAGLLEPGEERAWTVEISLGPNCSS